MTSADRAYDAFAAKIVDTGLITDPWFDGAPRFREEPVFVTAAEQRALYRAAEEVAAVYNELCLIVADEPSLLDDFFCLTPCQKAMWLSSQPLWHGIARADVFLTDEGPAIAELNCDTPTGEAEAVVLSALAAPDHPGARDPNGELGARFCAMVDEVARALLGEAATRRLGFVYPTEFTEDLSVIRLYQRWLTERGYSVLLGSPYNLGHDDRGLSLFDVPFSVLLRHYKTDWWGERSSVWIDEQIPDAEPLAGPLGAVLSAAADGRAAILNPLGAVLPQNKRSMAFMWEHLHRFSPHAQSVIQRHVPVTSRLETVHPELLLAQREEWVLKSDYGAEGEEVILGRHTPDEVWRASLAKAREGRWIAQRYFSALENARRESVNYGIYLIAGEACGIYARVQAGMTDVAALSAPALVR
ncbi:glutathionylspermidine synthase family protein [Sorangium sp. So ce117]|uniref:glutathionylspermidine synthase family protein n=1 Tax=Sorangium sp. So ce117 TaxID=3133277 RepID=UPI003F610831